MANYAVDPQLLAPYLPAHTRLDMYGGKTYVSLVGFLFEKTRLFGIPVPFYGSFEEVNLRFYVVGEEDAMQRRGVVFINETVPFKPVAFLANLLYSEHYRYSPMSHEWQILEQGFRVCYRWRTPSSSDQHLRVEASDRMRSMEPGSMEEFILEHYYGYTKISGNVSERYEVRHPSWGVHDVTSYDIKCDFGGMYGEGFAELSARPPDSVFLARGSDVQVQWERHRFGK
jgi:uncharacterized protein YqjF (DUF2071 family)